MNRNERINFLVRKNEGRRRLAGFRARFGKALGRPLHRDELVPLEASDKVRERFVNRLQEQQGEPSDFVRRTYGDAEDLGNGLLALGNTPRTNARVFVFFQTSDVSGAILIQEHEFFRKCGDLLEADGDSIYCTDCMEQNSVILDKFEVHESWAYEVFLWGEDWMKVFEHEQEA